MRAVWRGEAPVPDVPPIGPTPVQPGGPPLLTAAMGPKSLARSAVWADGLSGFDLAPDPASVARHVHDGARRVDAPPGGPSRPWLVDVVLVRARRRCDRPTARLRPQLPGDVRRRGGVGHGRALHASTTPGRLREALAALAETGCDEFVLVPTTDDVRGAGPARARPRRSLLECRPMGCGCLLALGAMLSPRLAIFFVWLFTDRMGIAFERFWMGLLGFLFLPWTTLAWALAYQPRNGRHRLRLVHRDLRVPRRHLVVRRGVAGPAHATPRPR